MWANLSISTIILTLYTINMVYALHCTIQHVIHNELCISYFTTLSPILMEGESPSIIDPSLVKDSSVKDNVFLSSTNNPNPNTNPTGGQVPVQNTGGGQVPVQNTGGGESSRPSIFSNDWRIIEHEPRRIVPVQGQGDNPTLFTTAREGERMDTCNTFSVKDGQVDYCEYRGANHNWNARNTCNSRDDLNNGGCFNCKSFINSGFHKCDHCFRHICDRCDIHTFNRHAQDTFMRKVSGQSNF